MAIFDNELAQLNEIILQMGSLVEDSIRDSVRALVDRDDAVARAVVVKDHQVNALDIEVDEESIRLIALRQPKGSDLRFITTAMKITTDLERMGDLAVNIAQRAIELNKDPLIKQYVDIPRMRDLTQGMTRDALDAFVRRDSKLARDVILRDDEIDELKRMVISELMIFMTEDPSLVCRAMRITFIATYLERIADHATNIAEMVIYLSEGKIIRHGKDEPRDVGHEKIRGCGPQK
ncbi:MAG TPA: phosphate signaling complex protein PhoU [Dissulfurispiraceae bacterium]|nr:phosphate signaling complex protein PhoU [Dissulfurispiraceae bacterium]